jgi:hypothetical protein
MKTTESESPVSKDRITHILLTLIAIALWGILLRPAVSVSPVNAQSTKTQKTPSQPVHLSRNGNSVHVASTNGDLLAVVPYDGKPIVVIRNDKISVWEVFDNGNYKHSLIMGDSKTVP